MPVRRQIEYMDNRYEAALKELSVTGRGKDASEIPRDGPLREEREKAVEACFFFEDWHEMRRDRHTSAPARLRVGGGEKLVKVGKDGLRKAGGEDVNEDEFDDGLTSDSDNADDQRGGKKTKEDQSVKDKAEDQPDKDKAMDKGKKRAISPEPTGVGPIGGSSKKVQRTSTAVDNLAATMEASIQERSDEAAARRKAEGEREEERLKLEREKIEISKTEADTRRIEALTARETQRQQGDLIMALLSKMNGT
ncbi:hypothetical protein CF319_g9291 [Tilletia indica]|nr:hypothetical protein CF319_g9291 [Tilletia indica]